jgi:hypothetical protein
MNYEQNTNDLLANHDNNIAPLPVAAAPVNGSVPGQSPVPPSLDVECSDPPAISAPDLFPRLPGETPRAFGAFLAYFDLGQHRSHAAVADRLGEKLDSVKSWSSRYRWSHRLAAFQSSLLRQQVAARLAIHQDHAADWARRTRECREQEWESARQLRAAAQCFLESFGDQQVEKMTLAQASHAVQVAARLARQALSADPLPETANPAPIQLEIEVALQKAYGSAAASTAAAPAAATAPSHQNPEPKS